MNRIGIIIVALCWMGFSSFALAQTEAAPESELTTMPGSSNEPQSNVKPEEQKEYELPEGPEGVVAQVGDVKILTQDLKVILDKTPYSMSRKKRKEVWQTKLASMIYSELLHSFLEENKIPEAPDELATLKKQLTEEVEKYNQTASLRLLPEITTMELMEREGLNEQRLADQARYQNLISMMITNEELLSFMNKNPDYFNGTTVHIAHILIPCAPMAPTAEQKKAVDKLQKIAEDIHAGKITFAQAAHEFSQCPSGKRKGPDGTTDYGDLGSWTFYPLASNFGASIATTVFSSDVGTLSDVVRSNIGFHLIKVLNRVQGNEPPGTDSAPIARLGITSLLDNQIFNQALNRAPIIIYKAAKKVPKPSKK